MRNKDWKVTSDYDLNCCFYTTLGFQETIGPTKESAVWVDETISVGPRLSMATYQQEDPLQISVEGNE